MDTACVELKFLDGSMIAIDTIAIENELSDKMYQQSEPDYFIYKGSIVHVPRSTWGVFSKMLHFGAINFSIPS